LAEGHIAIVIAMDEENRAGWNPWVSEVAGLGAGLLSDCRVLWPKFEARRKDRSGRM